MDQLGLSKGKWFVEANGYKISSFEFAIAGSCRFHFGQKRLTSGNKKWVSYLYRTAQLFTLASFRTWGSLIGAGRIRLTRDKCTTFILKRNQISPSW